MLRIEGAPYPSQRDTRARRTHEADESVIGALRAAVDSPPVCNVSNRGWVLIALQTAFYVALHSTTFEEGVVATVMRGGDTDTNAAI